MKALSQIFQVQDIKKNSVRYHPVSDETFDEELSRIDHVKQIASSIYIMNPAIEAMGRPVRIRVTISLEDAAVQIS